MNIEDIKKLGPDAQALILVLLRIETKVDRLEVGMDHLLHGVEVLEDETAVAGV